MAMAVSLRRAIKGLTKGAEVVRSSGLSAWNSPRAFSSSVSSLISEEEVRRFEEDGATVVRLLFAPEWLDQLRASAEENRRIPGVLCDEHVKPDEVKILNQGTRKGEKVETLIRSQNPPVSSMFKDRTSGSFFTSDEQRYKESAALPDVPDIASNRDEGRCIYVWVNAGLDSQLKAGEPLDSDLFPKVTAPSESKA